MSWIFRGRISGMKWNVGAVAGLALGFRGAFLAEWSRLNEEEVRIKLLREHGMDFQPDENPLLTLLDRAFAGRVESSSEQLNKLTVTLGKADFEFKQLHEVMLKKGESGHVPFYKAIADKKTRGKRDKHDLRR